MLATEPAEEKAQEPVLELAVLLPNGKKDRIDPAIARRESLRPGTWTPFTRLPIVPWHETGPRA